MGDCPPKAWGMLIGAIFRERMDAFGDVKMAQRVIVLAFQACWPDWDPSNLEWTLSQKLSSELPMYDSAYTYNATTTTWRMGGTRKCPPCIHPYHPALTLHQVLSSTPLPQLPQATRGLLFSTASCLYHLGLDSILHFLKLFPWEHIVSPVSLQGPKTRGCHYEKEFQKLFAGVSWAGISENGPCSWVGSRDLIGLYFVTVLRATGRSGEQQARGLQLLSLRDLALLLFFPSCASAFYFCLFFSFKNVYPSH